MRDKMTSNLIYLRYKSKVLIPAHSGGELNIQEVATLLNNLERLGFILSDELLQKLIYFSTEEIKGFYNSIIGVLRRSVGAHVKYEPMYPNFPEQVMQASDAELYMNARMHYFGDWLGVRIMPEYVKEDRAELTEKTNLKVIGLGNPDEFADIFTNLVGAKSSISQEDKDVIEWFIATFPNTIHNLFPKEIPLKENKAFVASLLLKHTEAPAEVLTQYFKTATDVLRLAVVMSDGDASLAANTKFKSFSRPERVLIMSLMEKCQNITEDMLRYKEQWKRLGEKLHPFEHKTRFKKFRSAMKVLIEDMKFNTFNSKVEVALMKKDISTVLDLLRSKPGDFARRLDHILRISKDQEEVIRGFSAVADRVSTPVLLQVMTHFRHRNDENDLRVFFPKGNIAKLQAVENKLETISQEVCDKVVFYCKEALIHNYKKLEDLGNVYLSEDLKQFAVPFAMRSASKALNTVSRGSRIKLPDNDIIRLFLWWKNGKKRVDIDLSVLGLDEDFKSVVQVSYTNLREPGATHSGDITSAPKGASEFVDLEIGKLLSQGVRYIVASAYSYTQQPYCELPECFVGFMSRKVGQSGKVYEPKTVQNKFDLAADSRIAIPAIFDLVERKMIWTDLSLSKRLGQSNNILNNMSSLEILSRAMVSLKKPTLYELFALHASARGRLVAEPEEADVVFSVDGDIKPTDIEEILANFL